jgi:Big-like domain-containing protein/galactose oxidase-like protein
VRPTHGKASFLRKSFLGFVVVTFVLSAWGCTTSSDSSTATTTPTLTSITVTAPLTSVAAGNTDQFTATGHYSDGSTQNLTSMATWNSSNTAAATISNTAGTQGLATGVAIGTTNITATLNTVTSSPVFSLTVTAAVLTSITVTAPFTSVAAGSTDQFTAIGHYSDGSTPDLTSTATWNSTNTAAATISNTAGTQGLATGVAIGSTNITATLNTVTSSPVFSLAVTAAVLTSITVTAPLTSVAPGITDQFTAIGHYADGSTQNLTNTATWNSTNTAAATISNTAGTQGLATGVAIGSTNITASMSGVTSSPVFSLTVTATALTSITVTPPFTSATAGSTDKFTATGHYSDGSTQNLTNTATWNSSNTAALTISNTAGTQGLATHVAIGSTRITASLTGVTSSPVFSLTVATAVLKSIAVTAPSSSATPGSTDQFTATGHYSDGSTQDLTSAATWNSTNTAAATVSNTAGTQGLATGVAIGSTNITATLNTVTSSPVFSLTVTAAVLASITVTAPLTSVAAGITDQFTAIGHYADGSTQNLTNTATWNSTNKAAATISSTAGTQGLATSVAIGSTNITASLNTVTSSPVFSLTVTAAVLTSITVTAPLTSVAPGITDQFTATGHYSDGSTPDLTSTATWNSTNTAAATVSNTAGTQGLTTGVAIGNTNITASMNGVTSSADTLTVSHGFVPTTGSLNVARESHTATLLNNGMVLIVGGGDFSSSSSSVLASAELYDPVTQLFTVTGSLNTARYSHTATLLNNGMVLIAGGTTIGVPGQTLTSAELYDPALRTFTSTGSMRFPRTIATATLLNNGMVLIAGGSGVGSQDSALATAELYDPATGTFTLTGGMGTARDHHTATLLNNGKVLIAGGYFHNFVDGALASAQLYDPATGTFTPTGTMTIERASHMATLLDDGMVLIEEGNRTSAELYDPAIGTFNLTAAATFLRSGSNIHTATLLNNGMVLNAEDGNFPVGPQLYDPATKTFTPTSAMTTNRAFQTATLLHNGVVLIAGGNSNISGASLASAELYTPDTLTPAGLVSIAVSPLDPTIPVGSDQRFVATGTFSDSTTERLASVTWSSSSSAVATVTSDASNHGAVHAVATGPATVSACDGLVCGSATLTVGVNGVTLMSITVTAPLTSVAAGSTDQFTAIGLYSDGSTQDLTSTATWNSTNTAAATISNTAGVQGLATSVAIGSTNITASMNGVTSSPVFSLTVTAAVLTSITVTAPLTSVAARSTDQFTATGHYSDGSTPDLTSAATWNSTNTSVATISNTVGTKGLATGVAFGSTNITASMNGVTSGPDTLAVASGFSFGLVSTGNLNTERYFHTATLLTNGKVLITGGICCGNAQINGNILASAELYDPASGTFSPTGSMAAARYGHTATLLNNGMVLIAGGQNAVTLFSSAEIYNPANGTFTPAGSMINGREEHVATLLNNGKVLITGGFSNLGLIANAELYDPAAGTFTPTGSMTIPRGYLTATLLNNGMVLIAYSGSSELYDPPTGTFTPTVNNNVFSSGMATLLNNGKVLLAGGGSNPLLAELYDPATGTFTFGGDMTAFAGLAGPPETLLNNGMVLISGDQGNHISDPELYDPATGTFTPSGALAPGPEKNTATLLSNGMVLIAGGFSRDFGSIASAELYNPATLTPAGLVSIAVSPLSPTISPGTSRRLIATGTFSDNSTEQLASVTWSSSNTAVATITNDATNEGAAFGAALGTSTIKACTGLVCGSTTLTVSGTGGVGAAASIAAAGGDGQSATVSTAFATPLQVIVEDASGNLVPNATVTFTAPASGASGTFANSTAKTTAVTNSSGVATASPFTANSASGGYSVAASVSGVSTTANFTLTNTPALLALILATGGSKQSAAISAAFATPLQATVVDAFGNLLPNLTVTFTAPASGASGTFANGTATTMAVTNSSGVATASAFTANTTLGPYSVTASVPGVITTASFSLANITSALTSIVATTGSGQSATVSTPFATALQATIKDALGNSVPNVTVTFTAAAVAASGTFANGTATTTAVTDSNGIATASAFVANRFAGVYSVTASVPGVTTTASFRLTNAPGAPASIVATGGGGQAATVSTRFATALQAAVQAATGHLIPNVTVTFTAPASGASGTFANGTATTTAVTDSNGMAAASAFTANSTPGGYKVTASASGVSATARFSMTNTPGGAASLVVTETYESQPVTNGGAIVLLDGTFAGRISSGSLTTQLTPGSHKVTILDVGGIGAISVVAVAGTSTPVIVDVHSSEVVSAAGSSNIPQIVGGVFAYADATKNPITIQFLDVASNPVIVTALGSAYLEDNAGDVLSLSSYTTITGNGTLSVNLVSALQTLGPDPATIAAKGPFSIDFEVEDVNGVPYGGRQRFGLGIYSITGTVQAPPSNPALAVGSVQLSFQSDSGVVLQATSGVGGAFTISGVPPDNYNVQGSFTSGGIIYTIQGASVVQGNVLVSVVPLGPFDIWDNVVSVTTTPALGAALAPAMSNSAVSATTTPIPGVRVAPAVRPGSLRAQRLSAAVPIPSNELASPPGISPFGPSVTNPVRNTDFCKSTTIGLGCFPSYGESIYGIFYNIPKGTLSVDVIYQVCTNQLRVGPIDAAGVQVDDENGNILFNDFESVYALSTSSSVFLFLPNGCTGVFQRNIDTSALTSSSPARIAVYANVLDSIPDLVTTVPTFVTVIIVPSLTIKSFTLDPFQSSCGPVNEDRNNPSTFDLNNIAVCPDASNGDFVSIPSNGADNCVSPVVVGNCFNRPATAVLEFPTDKPLTITNVGLEIVDLNGNTLDTIFSEAPGNRAVPSNSNTTLKLSSIGYLPDSLPSFGFPSNPLNSSLPAQVSYVLTVTGRQSGNIVTGAKNLSLSEAHPIEVFDTLWSAANAGVTIPRYSIRDIGGDDWATQNTIKWLTDNSKLIVSYNDISGEHGRNIGHEEHGKGTDIDIFQFATVNNATSGRENYTKLASAANSAVLELLKPFGSASYDPSFLNTVVNFVVQNRAGINKLNENDKVERTIFGKGRIDALPAGNLLAPGWLEQLMCFGTLDVKVKDDVSGVVSVVSVNLGGPNGLGYFGNGDATWNPAPTKRVSFKFDHDDHIHVFLGFPPPIQPPGPPSCTP